MDTNINRNRSLVDAALQAILDSTWDMMFIKDVNLIYHGASRPFADMVGLTDTSGIVGKSDFEIFEDQELARRYTEDDRRLLEQGRPLLNYIEPIVSKDGMPKYSATSKYVLRDTQDNIIGLCGISRDVTREYAAKASYEQELQYLFKLPPDALSAALFDIADWRIVDVQHRIENRRATASFQTIDEFITHLISAVVEEKDAQLFFENFSQPALRKIYESGKRHFSLEYRRDLSDGSRHWVRSQFHFLIDPMNEHLSLMTILFDIDAEKRDRDALRCAAEQDGLTGLLNRATTMKYIRAFLQQEGARETHALFLIDIDNFKMVNDTFGHQMGDTVIRNIANLIKSVFREEDIIGRMGGDEFFVLMKRLEKPLAVRERAKTLVEVLQHMCATAETSIALSASVGISFFTNAEKSIEQLYAEADIALYRAKERGKNQFSIFIAAGEDEVSSCPPAAQESSMLNLHRMLNKMDAGIVISRVSSGDRTKVLFLSDSLLAMMGGLSREEGAVLYADTLSTVHPDDLSALLTEYTKSSSEGRVLRAAHRMLGKGGVYHWVSVGVNSVVNENGSVDIYSVYTSIGHLMHTEIALREKHSLLELVLQHVHVSLYFYEFQTKCCRMIRKQKTLSKLLEEHIESFPHSLVDSGCLREDCCASLLAALSRLEVGKQAETVDLWLHCEDGEGWYCERSNWVCVIDESGKPIRAVALGTNITVEKAFEEEYTTLKGQLRRAANTFGIYRLNLSTNDCLAENPSEQGVAQPGPDGSADSLFAALCAQMEQAEARTQAQLLFSRKDLLRRYAQGERNVFLNYRAVLGGASKWLHTTIDMMRNPATTEVEALLYTLDVDYETSLQLTLQELFRSDYELICQVTAQTGAITLLAGQENKYNATSEGKELFYDSQMQSFLKEAIVEEYYEDSTRALLLEHVQKELQKAELFRCSFPTKSAAGVLAGYHQWRFRYLDQEKTQLIFTRTDITDSFLDERDALTGLYHRVAFYRHARRVLDEHPKTAFLLFRCDIDRFKAYNDTYGSAEGDRVLSTVGSEIRKHAKKETQVFGRLQSDHFVGLLPQADWIPDAWNNGLQRHQQEYSIRGRVSCSVGIYEIENPKLDVSLMCDRALLALKTVKNRYFDKIAWYDESLRQELMDEQCLMEDADTALREEQFVVYFQPQVDYEDGSLIGAEALVRWEHPVRGLLPPDCFIPLFEKNGFILKLDEYVWDCVCRHMRHWLDSTEKLIPISVSLNISRMDLYEPGLCEKLGTLMDRYQLEHAFIKLEITESAYMDNAEQLINVVKSLRSMGFAVEMDDFGKGYSSLNMLKDVPVDVLKLDVRFLSKGEDDSRAGSILSSVIRMAHWLKIPVIAEGVENKEQADHLKSLNCFYMQGYYFSRPMPEPEFRALLRESILGKNDRYRWANLEGVAAFWESTAQTALLFNSFVGGAAIMEYNHPVLEIARANDRFYQEVRISRKRFLKHSSNVFDFFDTQNRAIYLSMIQEAIQTGEEAQCELQSFSWDAGQPVVWTQNRARLLAKNAGHYLLYVSLSNITTRKGTEERLRMKQQELEIALTQLGALVCRYDIVERILYFSEDYASRYEIPAVLEDVPSAFSSVLEADRDKCMELLERIHRGEPRGAISVRIASPDGNVRWENYGFTTIFDDAAAPSQAIILMRDISAEMSQEAERQKNKLLLDRPDLCIFDYDVLMDVLLFERQGKGEDHLTLHVPDCKAALVRSQRIHPDSEAAVQDLIVAATETPMSGTLVYCANHWDNGYRRCRMYYVSVADESGQVHRIVGSIDDIQEEADREGLLAHLQKQLGVVAESSSFNSTILAQVLNCLYETKDSTAAIQAALRTVGSHYVVGRVYIFEDIDEHRAISNTFEWCADGIEPQIDRLHYVRYADDLDGGYQKNFDASGLFDCPDIRNLPSPQREFLEAQGIFAILQSAILENGSFRGFIGFDECRALRHWTEEQVGTLTLISRLVGTFLLHRHS